MNNPLISVVVPIYNVEPFLRQCVDSVLAQTYKNLQIILVDDGSPDGCPAVCDEYAKKDGRVEVIHEPNGGICAARNAGMARSKGQYVFFLDADDYLDSQCLEMMVPPACTGALVMTGYLLDFSNKGKLVEPEQAYGRYATMEEYYLDFHSFYATKFNFVWGKLYNVEVLRQNNIRFIPTMHLGEDVVFNMEYYRHCQNGVTAAHHNGYYYRQHSSSTLSKAFNVKMFEWNEFSFTLIRNFLKEFRAFTDENRAHLYRDIAGNYHYSFHLIALNKQMRFKDKVQMIRRYMPTPIYQESLSVPDQHRIDYRIMYWFLHRGFVRTFIWLEQIKNKLLYGNSK